MRLKICGLTRLEDAQLAATQGAFALGFVFYNGSPRAIQPELAAQIIRELPATPWKVGVFVNANYDTLMKTAEIVGLTHLQLHGNESPELCDALGLPVIKAFRLKAESDIKTIADYPMIYAALVDAFSTQAWGGTGQEVNWDWVTKIKHQRLILAGGLNVENIGAAQAQVQPFALDLSSGVESAPGIKDPQKMKDLFLKSKSLANTEGKGKRKSSNHA